MRKTNYAKINKGVPMFYPRLPGKFRHLSDAALLVEGFYPTVVTGWECNQKTYARLDPTWEVRDGVMYVDYPHRKKSTDEQKAEMLAEVRRKREPLLVEADHLVNDAIDKGDEKARVAASAYRQQLKDVTEQADPTVFPAKPETRKT